MKIVKGEGKNRPLEAIARERRLKRLAGSDWQPEAEQAERALATMGPDRSAALSAAKREIDLALEAARRYKRDRWSKTEWEMRNGGDRDPEQALIAYRELLASALDRSRETRR